MLITCDQEGPPAAAAAGTSSTAAARDDAVLARSSPAVKHEQFRVYYVLDGSKDFQRLVKESAPRHKYLINTKERLIDGAGRSLAILALIF
jgi:hypothetical protein